MILKIKTPLTKIKNYAKLDNREGKMQGSGKKVFNSKAQQKAVDINLKVCSAEMFLQEKYKAREEKRKNPSEETIRNNRLREIIKTEAFAEQSVMDSLVEAEKNLANQIYEFITSKFDFKKSRYGSKFYHSDISDEEIERVIIECLPALKELKSNVENGQYHKENALHVYNEYERLFNKLIDKDIRFASFAPVECVKRSTTQEKLNQLNGDIVDKINENQKVLNSNYDLTGVLNIDDTQEENAEILKLVHDQKELEFKSRIDMIKITEKFSQDLYNFIINDLNMQDFDEKTVKYKQIEETLNYCSNALNKLNKLSNNEYLTSISGWEEFDPYTEIFNNLINLNIKFVFFAPKKALNRLDIDYKRLSEKERNVMLKVLIDKGLWDNDEFYENYHQVFENGHNIGNEI